MARRIDALPKAISQLPLTTRQSALQEIVDRALGPGVVAVVRRDHWGVQATPREGFTRGALSHLEERALQALMDAHEAVSLRKQRWPRG